MVFVLSSQKSSGCICKSKWRSTTSISANKWLGKYSSSSMFSTPTCYHNPIYDPVGFASGIFDRYKNYIMMSTSTQSMVLQIMSWRETSGHQNVRYNINKYSMTSEVCHNFRNYSMTSKVRHIYYLFTTLFWIFTRLFVPLFWIWTCLFITLFWTWTCLFITLFWFWTCLFITLFWTWTCLFITLFWTWTCLFITLFWFWTCLFITLFWTWTCLFITLFWTWTCLFITLFWFWTCLFITLRPVFQTSCRTWRYLYTRWLNYDPWRTDVWSSTSIRISKPLTRIDLDLW